MHFWIRRARDVGLVNKSLIKFSFRSSLYVSWLFVCVPWALSLVFCSVGAAVKSWLYGSEVP